MTARGVAASEEASGLVDVPMVTTLHGHDASRRDIVDYLERHDRQLFHATGGLMAVSERIRTSLLSMVGIAERVCVHREGIEVDRFSHRPRRLDVGEPVRQMTVARLAEKKGLVYAVAALAEACRALGRDAVELTIVGDGPERPRIESAIAAHGLGDRVHLLGWRDRDDVAELLDTAHVFIAPSVTATDGDMEGVPTAIMEAMARGLPVISTRHSGIPELVDDGRSGRLVDEYAVVSLAKAIIDFAGIPVSWAAMGEAGRQIVVKRFNTDTLNDRLVDYYRTLIWSKDSDGVKGV